MAGTPDVFSVVSQMVQTAAIVIGGWWTYTLFVRQRTGVARANVSQTVEDVLLTESDRLIRVDIAIDNKGSTSIHPRLAESFVYGLRPISRDVVQQLLSSRDSEGGADDTLDWPELGKRELVLAPAGFFVEPGETEHLWVDLVISSDLQVVQVYSRVDCGKEYQDLFWDVTSLKSIAGQAGSTTTQAAR